ncbi:MAG: OmpP1/FadL family transporter [Dehalococcoidia bacterium]
MIPLDRASAEVYGLAMRDPKRVALERARHGSASPTKDPDRENKRLDARGITLIDDRSAPRISIETLIRIKRRRAAFLKARAFVRLALGVAMLGWVSNAAAIYGYFLPAYGPKATGVAGTGVAMPQDRMVGAINPAGLALIEPGLDANVMLLHPQRQALLDCTHIGQCDGAVRDRSKREFFTVPGFGYSRRCGERSTLGVTMYANGGLNTSYSRDLYDEVAARIAGQAPGDPGFPARGKIGVDFAQFITAFSFAHRASERWTVGVAPLLIIQKFSARGLAGFAPLSADPSSLDGRDSDYELGGGARVGALYQLRPDIRLGAQYTSRLYIHDYTKYNGLFVDGGSLDSPAHFTIGIAWNVTPGLTVSVDYQHIFFSSVDTIGNPGPSASELAGNIEPSRLLGGSNGIGFGWDDLSVYKFAVVHHWNDRVTLRAGWGHNSGVVSGTQALLAPIVPAGSIDVFTAGLTYRLTGGDELSVGYFHAFGGTTQNPQSAFFGVPVKAWAQGDGLNIGFSRNL